MSKQKEGEERERMDCTEFRDVLHELDRPGTRGAVAFESAMTHAESCGDCGALLVEEESLDFGLRKVARETARMPGAVRVEALLLREFRQAKPELLTTVVSHKVRWQIAVLGVAAAVFLVLGTTIHERNLTRTTATPVTTANAKANQEESSRLGRTAADNLSPVVNRAATTTDTIDAVATQQSVASETQGTEYATAYVRLPYADDPAGLEGGSVVRVTLARSALESYGLPAEGLGTGDRVTADMLVSEDGIPQAIRLVAQED
jgi:hypothetical protein